MNKAEYDVLIIGGNHTGLSAAMAIGRMRRSGLVVDPGKPGNEVLEHADKIAGLDGINPNQWRAQARDNLHGIRGDRRFSKSHSGVRRKRSTARDRRDPAPLGQGGFIEHMLPMIRSLSEDLVIFTQGKPKISDAFRVRLQKDSIPIIEDRILPWRTRHAALQGAVLTNGQQIEVSALFVPPVQHSVRGVAPTGSGTVLELANETF